MYLVLFDFPIGKQYVFRFKMFSTLLNISVKGNKYLNKFTKFHLFL